MTRRRRLSPKDLAFLRRTFDVARRARTHSNHPFGAILVDADGKILIEMENGFMPDRDMTGHAERLLATEASKRIDPSILARSTIYSSAEPCAMCAGAIYWAGIGRLVYSLSERRLKKLTGNHAENPTLHLPCRKVFAAGQRKTEVVGPLIEDEGAALHAGAWSQVATQHTKSRRKPKR
jgi:tRNA(Arg) A34 adenosine deaminase TadA